ncbi:MAG: GEVED domain-containing protein [Bacteroidota bacterium]
MKKQLLTLMSAFLLGAGSMQAQCLGTYAYGTATISTCPTGSTTIAGCNYKGDYAELTFNMTGPFTFDAVGGTTQNYLTLTDAANTPIAFGNAPLQATITANGVYRLHITDPACGTESECIETSYACVLPVCSGMPSTGTLSGSSFTICPGASTSFSVSGATQATGITYQWQESTNAGGPFTNVAGGTGGNTMVYTTNTLSTTMYYQMVVTCTASAMSATTSVVSVYPTNPFTLCYCQAGLGGSGCGGDNISNVTIISTGLNNTSTCNTTVDGTYTQFAPGAGTTATLTTGSSYSISINTTADNIESIWIDYNQNGMFEPTEHAQICTNSTPNTATGYNLLIPASATPGLTGMRVRSRASGNFNGPTDACSNFGSGETEDYIVTLVAGANCAGMPSAGTTPSSLSICSNNDVTIAAAGSTSSVGITYQWQESTSASGPFTNVTGGSGATTTAYTTPSLTTVMYYQMVVTCTASAMSATTTVTSVNMNPFSQCYCMANLGGSNCSGDNITNVTFISTGLNNTSTCNTTVDGTYTQFTPGAGTTATLTTGSSYSISINTTANNIESLWIDYNQNGTFDPSEHAQICITSTPSVATGYNLLIPVTAIPGQTGMRVRTRGAGNPNGDVDACTNFGSGETEDYTITLVAGANCSGAPSAGTTPLSLGVCSNNNITITSAGSTSSVGITYQWQESTSASGPFTNVTGGSGATTTAYTTPSLTTGMYYQMVVTCTASAMSATTAVTSVSINAVTQCYCQTMYTSGCSGDQVDTVIIGSLANYTNGCPGAPYNTFFNALPIPNYSAGSNVNATFVCGSGGTHWMNVWIDLNDDGVFAAAEALLLNLNVPATAPVSTVIPIPAGATLGNHRMRVICYYGSSSVAFPDACGPFGYGETEDYTVNIDLSTGVKNTELNSGSLIIYPNPANEMVSIYTESVPANSKVVIYNAVGDLVTETTVNGNKTTINTANFATGIYIVKLVNGTSSVSKKLVIYK